MGSNQIKRENSHGIMANVMNSDLTLSIFKLQSCCYVNILTNNIEKGIEPPYPPIYRLKSTTTVLLQGWLWH